MTGLPGRFATVSSVRLRSVIALLGVPIGVVFLRLAVRNADLHAVWLTLRDANLSLVALALCDFGLVYLMQAVRWRRIAAAPTIPVGRFYEMTVSGIAVNNLLPGRLGDFLRARWLGVEASIALSLRGVASFRSARGTAASVNLE